MFIHTITIGRNVGTDPMNDVAWSTFQTDMQDILAGEAPHWEILSTHIGEGEWDGITENSAIITMVHSKPLSPQALMSIRSKLAYKCREYKQEAIAFTANAVSELITFDRHSGI